MSSEYYLDAAAQNGPSGEYVVQVYGRNAALSTTIAPISIGGIFRTPQASAGTKLRVKAGNANDTANGSGARKVRIYGIDTTGAHVEEDLVTAGTSASANSSYTYIRLFKASVMESGTYGTSSAGSHAADIVIENSAGTENWGTIDSSIYPKSETEIALYTVPAGKQAYITSIHSSFDTAQTLTLLLFKRDGILQTAAPYKPVSEVHGITSSANFVEQTFQMPLGPFGPLTDIGVMGKMSASSTNVRVGFELLLRNQE